MKLMRDIAGLCVVGAGPVWQITCDLLLLRALEEGCVAGVKGDSNFIILLLAL